MIRWHTSTQNLRHAGTLLCLIMVTGIGTGPAYANHFISALSYPAGPDPAGVAVADFNGDGRLDLAVASFDVTDQAGSVAILLGNGDGSFRAPHTYATGSPAYSVAVGDFNGDGIPDLVVTSQAGSIAILLGNGDGTFQPAHSYATPPLPNSLAVADFNGDGHLDIAVTVYLDQAAPGTGVSILLGNGDGTFQGARTYPTPHSLNVNNDLLSLALADLNGDGKLDLVTANDILLGNGDGTFQAAKSVPVDYGKTFVSVAIGDFNGDGIPDLALAGYDLSYQGELTILLGNGDASFQVGHTYSIGLGGPYIVVIVADFDGDGIADLAMATLDSTLSVLRGNGDGTFQEQIYAIDAGPAFLAVGDFTGDGHLDLVTANPVKESVSILLGTGDGTLRAPKVYSLGLFSFSVAVGDLNGDGIPDLAVAGNYPSELAILLGNGDGTFKTSENYAVGPNLSSVTVADFNGDGIPDLAVAIRRDDSQHVMLSILLGNGDGTFRPNGISYDAGPALSSVAIGDFNGDGFLDLAVAGSAGLSILLGNGDGTFQAAGTYALGDYANSVAVGDFNGDGILDLAVATGLIFSAGPFPEGHVLIFMGNGDGTFRNSVTFPGGRGARSLAVADFNGDGNQDIVTANYATTYSRTGPVTVESDVHVFLGNGDGTFQAAHLYGAGDGPSSVAVADVDGDGIPDLVVANSADSTVGVLLGNGDGTFRQAQYYGVGAHPYSVAVADFNRDGLPDVVVVNLDFVTVLLNGP